jgi:hypothetical protein
MAARAGSRSFEAHRNAHRGARLNEGGRIGAPLLAVKINGE